MSSTPCREKRQVEGKVTKRERKWKDRKTDGGFGVVVVGGWTCFKKQELKKVRMTAHLNPPSERRKNKP